MQLDYPSVIEEMEEMQAIFAAEEKVGEKFEKRIEECDKNTAISTANEVGIARREKILKVIPQDTEDMEERRFRVMAMWNDSYPYTQESLLVRLDELLGKGNYTLAVSYTHLHCQSRKWTSSNAGKKSHGQRKATT